MEETIRKASELQVDVVSLGAPAAHEVVHTLLEREVDDHARCCEVLELREGSGSDGAVTDRVPENVLKANQEQMEYAHDVLGTMLVYEKMYRGNMSLTYELNTIVASDSCYGSLVLKVVLEYTQSLQHVIHFCRPVILLEVAELGWNSSLREVFDVFDEQQRFHVSDDIDDVTPTLMGRR